MANHSSVHAWGVHCQRRLVGYSLWCRKGVEHNLVTKTRQIIIYEDNASCQTSWLAYMITVVFLCGPYSIPFCRYSHYVNCRQYLLRPLQCSCLENPIDGGAWWAAVHGLAQSRTRLSDFTFTFHFHALEKEMATHSSVLACRIPGTGEPGGLPSMGSLRVGHDSSDLAVAVSVAQLKVVFFSFIFKFY